MAPVIRIDDEVMSELERRAYQWRLVFGTPNQALRRLLGLDNPSVFDEFARHESKPVRVRGKELLVLHPNLQGQGLKPYAARDGVSYPWPSAFPAVFFDRAGYVVFRSEESLSDVNQYGTRFIYMSKEPDKVYIREGISSLEGYVTCPLNCHNHFYRSAP